MAEVHELSNNEFDDFIEDGTVLIDFWAGWCMPCLMMAPVIEELSEKFDGKIKFGKIEIDENKELAQKFNVRSIPNFVLFKDGKKQERFIGAIPAEEFGKKLEKFV